MCLWQISIGQVIIEYSTVTRFNWFISRCFILVLVLMIVFVSAYWRADQSGVTRTKLFVKRLRDEGHSGALFPLLV